MIKKNLFQYAIFTGNLVSSGKQTVFRVGESSRKAQNSNLQTLLQFLLEVFNLTLERHGVQ